MRAELFYADGRIDGQTDRQTTMTQLIVYFRNFANAPKNGLLHLSLASRCSLHVHIFGANNLFYKNVV